MRTNSSPPSMATRNCNIQRHRIPKFFMDNTNKKSTIKLRETYHASQNLLHAHSTLLFLLARLNRLHQLRTSCACFGHYVLEFPVSPCLQAKKLILRHEISFTWIRSLRRLRVVVASCTCVLFVYKLCGIRKTASLGRKVP